MTDHAIDGLNTRTTRLAQDPPAELPEWMATIEHDNVRSLSVGLLLDLLTLETDAGRASSVARDLTALAEGLLLAGADEEARAIIEALASRAHELDTPGGSACRAALDHLGASDARRASGPRAATPPVPRGYDDGHARPWAGTGIAAARQAYTEAVATAETLWNAARAGQQPDPDAARAVIDTLARLVGDAGTSLVALTALKRYDNYTFTHMVNVSVLAMAQARALNVNGPLLREFGLAALMHDIGKVNTPAEVLHKPDKLTKEEFDIMKQHVVDGAHILRQTPGMPALAPIVAFEHHLKQDLSGYPENVGSRTLNLCTMIVSIADVFDALRSNRPYRQGLATSRIRAIMSEQGNPQFNQVLLKRFVNLMGLFPIGALVRLSTGELAVVTAEHPSDPFHPQVKVIASATGELLEVSPVVNTWEREGQAEHPRAVVEALDPEEVGLDPLKYL